MKAIFGALTFSCFFLPCIPLSSSSAMDGSGQIDRKEGNSDYSKSWQKKQRRMKRRLFGLKPQIALWKMARRMKLPYKN